MIRVLAFDLDDTLLDTSKHLIPIAARLVCEAMVGAGLKTTVDQCVRERSDFLHHQPHGNVYHHLLETFGMTPDKATPPPTAEELEGLGRKAYHQIQIPQHLPLIDGAKEMLEQLQKKYALHLVTSGRVDIQNQKIAALQIAPYFRRIWVTNPYQGQTKKDAFAQIIASEGIQPHELLSIGNRLDLEIREAKELGCQTCWLPFGEFSQLQPRDPSEKPDFQLSQITDLIRICRL